MNTLEFLQVPLAPAWRTDWREPITRLAQKSNLAAQIRGRERVSDSKRNWGDDVEGSKKWEVPGILWNFWNQNLIHGTKIFLKALVKFFILHYHSYGYRKICLIYKIKEEVKGLMSLQRTVTCSNIHTLDKRQQTLKESIPVMQHSALPARLRTWHRIAGQKCQFKDFIC